MKCITKPTILTVVRWNGFNFGDNNQLIINSFKNKTMKINFNKLINDGYVLEVKTPKGIKEAIKGDFIVQDINGGLSVYSPDNFDKNFDIIEGK